MSMDKVIQKKKGIRPKHIFYSLGVLALGLLIFYSARNSSVSSYRIEMDKLTIAEIVKDEFRDYISITGEVEPISTIFLDAEEAGKVAEIVTEEGEMVKKGDVILRLVNNDLIIKIMDSESGMAYRSNELRNTVIRMNQDRISNKKELTRWDLDITRLKRVFEQNETLNNKGLISKEDYLRSKEDYEYALKLRQLSYEKMIQDSLFSEAQRMQMDANLNNLERNLSMVRMQLENLNVKAPVDGQLGLLNAEIGQSIGKGQPIGQINILTSYKIKADVDEFHIDRVMKGLSGVFERQDAEYELQVKKVFPEVRNGTFEIDMVFKKDQPDNIRTGQTYHIRLELGEPKESILIARGGFFQTTGGQWVYVLDSEGQFAEKRAIRIGRQNPMYYEVLEGLKPGEKVITSSYDMFGDNDRIVFK